MKMIDAVQGKYIKWHGCAEKRYEMAWLGKESI